MKEQGFYEQWLIPQLELNGDTLYANQPVENQPEFIPLDNYLNTDTQFSLSQYYAITVHLNNDDSRFFSIQTPLTIVEWIRKIYSMDGHVPSLRRSIQDCNLALRTFGVVYAYRRRIVPALVNRNGHHNHAGVELLRVGAKLGWRMFWQRR